MVKEDSEEAEDTFPEQFRSYSENDKHWEARRAFIMRNIPPEDWAELSPLRMDQLLSLSMVWANHLFLGCSYNKDLLDKVTEMAEGIEVEDAPHFITRDELMRKVNIWDFGILEEKKLKHQIYF
ncbi:hypothetical protein lerEdw1_016251 [Lerista edwardsae]|nr:hypothetical protein lerEdw1_016251 [Lerista edwardsae]